MSCLIKTLFQIVSSQPICYCKLFGSSNKDGQCCHFLLFYLKKCNLWTIRNKYSIWLWNWTKFHWTLWTKLCSCQSKQKSHCFIEWTLHSKLSMLCSWILFCLTSRLDIPLLCFVWLDCNNSCNFCNWANNKCLFHWNSKSTPNTNQVSFGTEFLFHEHSGHSSLQLTTSNWF